MDRCQPVAKGFRESGNATFRSTKERGESNVSNESKRACRYLKLQDAYTGPLEPGPASIKNFPHPPPLAPPPKGCSFYFLSHVFSSNSSTFFAHATRDNNTHPRCSPPGVSPRFQRNLENAMDFRRYARELGKSRNLRRKLVRSLITRGGAFSVSYVGKVK